MILIIDNYDSFTYNLVQYFEALHFEVVVFYNDQITIDQIKALKPDAICVSPGPGSPSEAKMVVDIIQAVKQTIPILGVCLGHQMIVEAFGGRVMKARQPMHGKQDMIFHDNEVIYDRLPNPLQVTRYHSLIADPDSLPEDLIVTSTTEAGEVMSVRHRALPVEGIQFHPEAILTEHGMTMLKQFLQSHNIYPELEKTFI